MSPKLVIDKRSETSKPTGEIGQDLLITYTIVVTNIGIGPEPNVVITDSLPVNLSYVPNSAIPAPNSISPLVWRVGALMPGQHATVRFVANVLASNQSVVLNVAVVGNSVSSIVASDEATNNLDVTAIALEKFTAIQDQNGIRIRWSTSLEQNTYGFYIYRSENYQKEDAIPISHQIIPARGRLGGASYEMLDPISEVSAKLHYWLVEVELDGNTIYYGPITVDAGDKQAEHNTLVTYLPLIAH